MGRRDWKRGRDQGPVLAPVRKGRNGIGEDFALVSFGREEWQGGKAGWKEQCGASISTRIGGMQVDPGFLFESGVKERLCGWVSLVLED